MDIKDLKDLRFFGSLRAIDMQDLKDLKRKEIRFSCVARGPVPRERSVDRSLARDRPSPYGE